MLDLLIRRNSHPDYPQLMDTGLTGGRIVYLSQSGDTYPAAARIIDSGSAAPLSGLTAFPLFPASLSASC
ncbi:MULTISPECIES: hypothetical protein [Paenibacillus]|uniref:hypothetical protein n=1 Tax=Paenibacillus TaxID=44249 RepID=UPI0022B87640|nr:hypothetical protein [Paenibacillus caseinilyticus]MCZ8519822.1 hypothetical protein [Paenibacillus caseinilyticus]